MRVPLEDIVGWQDLLREMIDPTIPMSCSPGVEEPSRNAREKYLVSLVREITTAQGLPSEDVHSVLEGCREFVPEAEVIVWDAKIYLDATQDAHERIGKPVHTRLSRTQLWLAAPQPSCPDGYPQLGIHGEASWCGVLLIPARLGPEQKSGIVAIEIFIRSSLDRTLFLRVWGQIYDDSVGEFYAEVETAIDFLNEEADWEPDVVPRTVKSAKPSACLQHDSRYCIQIRRRLPEGMRRKRDVQKEVHSKEFRCHFEVSEHIRRLAQPRKRDGAETTTVRAHVRGDKTMPFRPKPKLVTKVTR